MLERVGTGEIYPSKALITQVIGQWGESVIAHTCDSGEEP